MAFIIRTIGCISAMCLLLFGCGDTQAMRFAQHLADLVMSVNNVKATTESLGFVHEKSPVTPTQKYLLNRMLWGVQTAEDVQSLVARKADVNSGDNEGDTALHYAAFAGNSAAVVELLKVKATVDVYSNEHGTALMVAATQGHWDTVKKLIAAGADPYASNYDGVTVFDMMPDEDSAKKIREIVSDGLLGDARVVCK